MTYQKPYNVSYTDMAIWIDANAYCENCDESKMYEYLYLLAHMLALEKDYFHNNFYYYDNFALYMANYVFLRYRNSKQYEKSKDGSYKLEKIKSVLNYMKGCLYAVKVLFEQEYYAQNSLKYEKSQQILNEYYFKDILDNSVDSLHSVDNILYLNNIPQILRKWINNIPTKVNSTEKQNIYISCLLSLLNLITPTHKQIELINHTNKRYNDVFDNLQEIYSQNKNNFVVLYHLPNTYYNYIYTLTIEAKHLISEGMLENTTSEASSDVIMMNMLFTSEEYDEY